MKAISLWQPWASLIAAGGKQIETRSWAPPKAFIGQPLAICSTKYTLKEVLADAWRTPEIREFMRSNGMIMDRLPKGAVVAVCVLGGSVKITEGLAASLSPLERAVGYYAPGRFAWILENVIALREPVPVIGRQGFFDVDIDPDLYETLDHI